MSTDQLRGASHEDTVTIRLQLFLIVSLYSDAGYRLYVVHYLSSGACHL